MSLAKRMKNVKFSPLEQQLIVFLEQHSQQLSAMGIQGVARANYTSTTSVFRLAQKLGFSGFKELIYYLDNYSGATKHLDDNSTVPQIAQEINLIFSVNQEAVEALKLTLNQENLFFVIIANGYAAIIGEYLMKKLHVKGYQAIRVTSADSLKVLDGNAQRLTHAIILSRSGETESIIRMVNYLAGYPIKKICFTQNIKSPLSLDSDISFEIFDQDHSDWDNVQLNSFHPYLLLYFEYLLRDIF